MTWELEQEDSLSNIEEHRRGRKRSKRGAQQVWEGCRLNNDTACCTDQEARAKRVKYGGDQGEGEPQAERQRKEEGTKNIYMFWVE